MLALDVSGVAAGLWSPLLLQLQSDADVILRVASFFSHSRSYKTKTLDADQ